MADHRMSRFSRGQKMGLGGAALFALGVAGGAGAITLTRPPVEMAPTVATAIIRLPTTKGVVTVKGRVAEVYGDRFIVQDATGRTLVDAGRRDGLTLGVGSPILVQGRFDDGQLHARYLVDASGTIQEVGPPPPHRGFGPPPPGMLPPPPPGTTAMETQPASLPSPADAGQPLIAPARQ